MPLNEGTAAEDDRPVSAEEFAAAMAALGRDPEAGRVAVAVSGGPDSMALALLARDWGHPLALIVDHGLRAGSAAEAAQTAKELRAAGIDSEILVWEGDKPKSGIQAAARAARYRLLEARCRAEGIDALLLAHHRDDRAETFLLRLARGSGLRGLAGLAPLAGPIASPAESLPLRYRPLLAFPKTRLIATCAAFGVATLFDPSNASADFDRTAVRRFLAAPPLAGLGPARLAATAARLSRAAAALDHYVARHIARIARLAPEGHVLLAPALLGDAPLDVALRALSDLVRIVAGREHAPEEAAVERLMRRLAAPGFRGATLAGCRLLPTGDGRLILCREYDPALPPLAMTAGECAVFDNRFFLTLVAGAPVKVAPLGPEGLAFLRTAAPSHLAASDLPHAVRLSLPAAFRDGRPVAVPHLGHREEGIVLEAELLAARHFPSD